MTDRMTVSFSGMQLYEGCPSAFERRYILKEELPKGKPHPAMARGLTIHEGVENYLGGAECQIPDEAVSFEGLLESLRDERDVKCECKFALTEDWEVVPFTDPRAMVRGVLDGLYAHEGVVHVWEWKTGRWYAEHALQRSLYALAGLALYPYCNDVIVQTVYFDQAKMEALEVNRDYTAAHKRVWKQRADAPQPPQVYKQTPNWKCNKAKKYCDYHVKSGGTCNGKAT